jgi:hypothetical protein
MQRSNANSHKHGLALRIAAFATSGLTLVSLNTRAQVIETQEALNYRALRAAHPGWVQVPGMLIRPECVHHVPNGATLRAGDVIVNDTVIAHYNDCAEPGIWTRPWEGATMNDSPAPPGLSGYVEYANMTVNLPANTTLEIYGQWTVPPPPPANGGLIYLWNGLTYGSGASGAIVQPVLQYGNNPGYTGGGNYWGIASWQIDTSGTFYSDLQQVNPGDEIIGEVTLAGLNQGSGFSYTVFIEGFLDSNNAVTSGFTTQPLVTAQYNVAYLGALEAFYVTSCAMLPAGGSTLFYDNLVQYTSTDNSGPATTLQPSLTSNVKSVTPSCGYSAPYVNGSTDTGTTVTLNYSNSSSGGSSSGGSSSGGSTPSPQTVNAEISIVATYTL